MSEEEIQMAITSNPWMLSKRMLGYTVEFHKDYDVGANVALDMKQVHNLGTILFHFLNDLGFEIMQSTPEETIFVLGADERIRELHNEGRLRA